MSYAIAFLTGLVIMLCGIWLGRRLALRKTLPLKIRLEEIPKLDIRKPHMAKVTACRLCSAPISQHPAMVNDKCEDCRAAEFEASEEKDRRGWEKGGEIVRRDWS